ncbi:hypothetical protein EDD22DRAFT_988083 [Suillus occidentalis]|nr:hypothetical protein EDD22DRAFT_988083 [Suillus occidentalis]
MAYNICLRVMSCGCFANPNNQFSNSSSTNPVYALLFLHGRFGSAQDKYVVDIRKKDLIVVAFDHRNHGKRLVDQQRTLVWSKVPAKNDDQHAEPRLIPGIPIIGCPDYTKLISQRAASSDIPFSPPYFPVSFPTYVGTHDPAQLAYRAKDASNPFFGKKVLVLSGKEDKLVPWVASAEFVDGLEVWEGGVKRVVVEEGAGHEYTRVMQKEAGVFVREWLGL